MTAQVWPRLDPGAPLCRTEDDLARRAANATVAAAGGVPSERADCRTITSPTAITIVQRHAPARTEVRVTADGSTGWTDVWLPERAPSR